MSSDTESSARPSRSARRLIVAAPFLMAAVLFGLMGNSHDPDLYGPSILSWLVLQWLDPGSNAAHGWLIPVVSGYLVWRKRADLAQAARAQDLRGLFLILLLLVVYWVGYRSQQPRFGVVAFIGILWAVPLYLFGTAVARHLLFPCAYLAFAIPLGFLLPFTFQLRLASSALATGLLQGFAVPVSRHGTAILSSDGSFPPFDVADPCSGLNSLIALTALTAAYAYLTIRETRLRWLMFISAIPIAMACNMIRIAVVVLAARSFGRDVAMTIYHDYSGYIVFVGAVLLVMGIGSFLRSGKVTRWLTRSARS